jgi:hypothetical protein
VVRLSCQGADEPPALHLGQVADQTEQRQSGGAEGAPLQLLLVEAGALQLQGGAVVVEILAQQLQLPAPTHGVDASDLGVPGHRSDAHDPHRNDPW